MRKQPFFETKGFNNLRLIVERRKIRNTLKNHVIFMKLYQDVINLASEEYGNVGWDKNKGEFKWEWDFHGKIGSQEFTDKQHYDLFKIYWPEGVNEPDYSAMIKELSNK